MAEASLPRPEHPRPQLGRPTWMNLNGTWEFDLDPGGSGEDQGWTSGRRFSRTVTVPFPPDLFREDFRCGDNITFVFKDNASVDTLVETP